MVVFVTGAGGQLGHDIINELLRRGHTPVASDIRSLCETPATYVPLDITDRGAVERAMEEHKPDAVIHCAAWTAVDAAEKEENRFTVRAINVTGTQNVADACKKAGSKMIYISTDYVFNGRGETPWRAEETDFDPLNVYGQSKLDGEFAVSKTLERYFIVRIAWAFGVGGKNFVRTMLNVGKKRDEVRVVCDQIGAPTYTKDLARLLTDMAESEKYGVYHATNGGGYVSRSDLTRQIYRMAGISAKVIPVTTAEYGETGAVRPHNSRMDLSKLINAGFEPLPDWKDAVSRYLYEIGEKR